MPIDRRYAEFAELLTPGVRRAARIARSLEGRVPNRPKPDEPTAVKQALTSADTQCQEALLESLHAHFPDVRLAAEEDTPGVANFPSESSAESDAESDALVIARPVTGWPGNHTIVRFRKQEEIPNLSYARQVFHGFGRSFAKSHLKL